MKKLIALLLVLVMVLSLTACKSKEQKAADQFLKDMEALLDDVIAAVEDEDVDAMEDLMEELKEVALEALERCQRKRVRDWSTIKSAIKNDLSGYLYKHTKRNPMLLPVIMEI